MRHPDVLARGKRREFGGLISFLLRGIALILVVAGALSLGQHLRSREHRPFRAPAALILIFSGVCQWRLARLALARLQAPRATRPPRLGASPLDLGATARIENPRAAWAIEWLRSRLYWRLWVIGVVAAFAVCLTIGGTPYVRYLFRAILATWHTLLLAPIVAGSVGRERILEWTRRRPLIWSLRGAYAGAVFVALAEGALRGADWMNGGRFADAYVAWEHRLPPGQTFRGRRVNRDGYWDDEFDSRPTAGVTRVAALGHEAVLSGAPEGNCLTLLERRSPGLEVYNFGIPHAGPREFAAQVSSDVAPRHPDVVIVFLSVAEDVTREGATPSTFEWRELALVQWAARAWGLENAGVEWAASSPTPQNYESHLRERAAAFTVLKTPVDRRTEERWRATLGRLDRLAGECRRRGLPLAFVLLPDEFQLNPTLREALRRRAGYEPAQIDLELPQRRFKEFADRRRLPLLDLTPELRSSTAAVFDSVRADWNERGHELIGQAVAEWLPRGFGVTKRSDEL